MSEHTGQYAERQGFFEWYTSPMMDGDERSAWGAWMHQQEHIDTLLADIKRLQAMYTARDELYKELEARLHDARMTVTTDANRYLGIIGDLQQQNRELREAATPFVSLAKEALNMNGREVAKDSTPVYAINFVQITVGDCRKLDKALRGGG